jgi:hypothetical protein
MTPMVDNLRDIRPPWRGAEIPTTDFGESTRVLNNPQAVRFRPRSATKPSPILGRPQLNADFLSVHQEKSPSRVWENNAAS